MRTQALKYGQDMEIAGAGLFHPKFRRWSLSFLEWTLLVRGSVALPTQERFGIEAHIMDGPRSLG
jgi:hypothetical protein